MTTTAASLLLLVIFWALNYGTKGRIQKIKFLKFLYDQNKAVLPRLNILMLAAAGFGLAQQWVGNLLASFNIELLGTGVKIFPLAMLAGVILFVVDMFDGGGIKNSSYGIAFALPIIAASSGGGLAATITAVSGGINEYAQTMLASVM
ncbi:hypothetical protein AB0395_22005 [Streptosporangium sp. NPDC051023]|uniref:hypothetical protein n=1 Tax=Streptosporangium sp. NPDC051023 TaxID=3155410 RepID=UPI0034508103